MTKRRFLLATVLLLAAGGAAFAADIRVPQDQANLLDALLAAQDGDRILVTGGKFRNGRITKANLTIVGSRTTFLGTWEILAPGAVIEGISFGDGQTTVTGDIATFRRCRFLPGRPGVHEGQFFAENITGLVIEECRATRTYLSVRNAPGAVFRKNRIVGGYAEVDGDLVIAEDNIAVGGGAQLQFGHGADIVVRRNRAAYLTVAPAATRALVEDNTVTSGLGVEGDSARVTGNRLVGASDFSAQGAGAEVTGNDIAFHNGTRYGANGMIVAGDGLRVTDNVISNDAPARHISAYLLLVDGAGPVTVRDNDITHVACRGIRVTSPGAVVSSNTIRGLSCGASIEIVAPGCTVEDNVIEQSGSRAQSGSGIFVLGDGNAFARNTVSGARYDGIDVTGANCTFSGDVVRDSGRCGITVEEDASDASFQDCVSDGARWAALMVFGDRVVLRGSFTGGARIDVLDFGRDTDLTGATFGTISTDLVLKPFK